jgi:hypothetical protein
MNFSMRPVVEDGIRKVSLGNGLVFALDVLPNELRRRYDVLCAHIERGDNVAGAIKAMTREMVEALWPQIMMRAAQRGPRSALDIGQDEAQR